MNEDFTSDQFLTSHQNIKAYAEEVHDQGNQMLLEVRKKTSGCFQDPSFEPQQVKFIYTF